MQPTIHRSERICIDISDSVVSIIKLDPEGVMIKAGHAKAPSLPAVPDDAYVTDLSSAIRKAAWAANISTTLSTSCVVVAGIPGAIIQRFTWPDMPADALHSIVHEEMVPYLSGEPSHYTIGYEILRLEQVDVSHPANLEIIVAALPIEFTSAITTACRWANFKPKRMDLREGARGRLVHFWCAPVEGEVPSTYAVLDIGPGLANIAFYHNGLFHSNRYFTPEFVKLDEVDDFELLMTVKTGGIDDNENAMRYDAEKLTNEILSSIDHFYRSINRHKLSCILLMDEENLPGIEENLRANVDILVLRPEQWVTPGIKRPSLRRIEQAQFLDAFAAGMPPLTNHGSRMDLQMSDVSVMAGQTSPHVASHVRQTPRPEPFVEPEHMQSPLDEFSEPHGHDTFDNTESIHNPFADLIPEPALHSNSRDNNPEPVRGDFSDLYADMISERARASETIGPIGHEFPYDPIRPHADNPIFPHDMSEEQYRPASASKIPLFAAMAITAVVLLIAILIPLRTTLGLRAELREYNARIQMHITADELFMLEQERAQLDRQISAIRRDIQYVNESRSLVRVFYLNPPALITIPEILYHSGIRVDSITANDHQIIAMGRIPAHEAPSIPRGTTYLREVSPYHHLFSISFSHHPTEDGTGVDEFGYIPFTITIVLRPNDMPFWLSDFIERWR